MIISKKYYVVNRYNSNDIHYSWHKSIKAAQKKANSHEGIGWAVCDDDGKLWAWDDNIGVYAIAEEM